MDYELNDLTSHQANSTLRNFSRPTWDPRRFLIRQKRLEAAFVSAARSGNKYSLALADNALLSGATEKISSQVLMHVLLDISKSNAPLEEPLSNGENSKPRYTATDLINHALTAEVVKKLSDDGVLSELTNALLSTGTTRADYVIERLAARGAIPLLLDAKDIRSIISHFTDRDSEGFPSVTTSVLFLSGDTVAFLAEQGELYATLCDAIGKHSEGGYQLFEKLVGTLSALDDIRKTKGLSEDEYHAGVRELVGEIVWDIKRGVEGADTALDAVIDNQETETYKNAPEELLEVVRALTDCHSVEGDKAVGAIIYYYGSDGVLSEAQLETIAESYVGEDRDSARAVVEIIHRTIGHVREGGTRDTNVTLEFDLSPRDGVFRPTNRPLAGVGSAKVPDHGLGLA